MLRRLFRKLLPSRATLRVSTYGVFAFMTAGFLAARALKADVTEAALAAGHELTQLVDLLDGGETISLNGERMHHASAYTDQDINTVLDRFEAYCLSSPNFLARAMRELPAELAKAAERETPGFVARLGIVRSESKDRGMVACFADDRPSSVHELGARLQRFLTTSKISEFGQLRYAYVERASDNRAHVVTTWADTGLDVGVMFPATGDAAGTDSGVLPRPLDARRMLTAAAEGHPYAVRVYVSRASREAVRAQYGAWMAQHGFVPSGDAQDTGSHTSVFIREDGYQAFVSLAEAGGTTSVTLTEAGFKNRSTIATVRATVD